MRHPYFHKAVMLAYENIMPSDEWPSYFIYLDIDPHTIDINIHLTKTEIKFEDEHTLYAILRSAIKHSLGQFSIAPVLDFDRDANLDTPYNFKNRDANVPRVEVDSAFNPFQDDVKSTSKFGSTYKKDSGADWESLYVGIESKSNSSDNFSSVEFETDEVTSSMFDEEETRKVQKTFQIQNKYIVNTIKSGVLIIDQNKAHQRILYEEYLQNITESYVCNDEDQPWHFHKKPKFDNILRNQEFLELLNIESQKYDHYQRRLNSLRRLLNEVKSKILIELEKS